MASTKHQTDGTITLKGSSDLVKEYLGMYNKFKTREICFELTKDPNLIPKGQLNLHNIPVLICIFCFLFKIMGSTVFYISVVFILKRHLCKQNILVLQSLCQLMKRLSHF